MAPPSTKHQRLTEKLFNVISNHISQKGGDCEPFISPFAVFLMKMKNITLSRISA
ncbi:MAG: hypothetical protein UDG86_07385 [Lachnospiraceae bacterium]|nr:hypothetical protein [Lachnospiraceae bacterium]